MSIYQVLLNTAGIEIWQFNEKQKEKMPQFFKGTDMQTEKALINDLLRVSKVSLKFHIPTIYNFVAITREIFYFLKK